MEKRKVYTLIFIFLTVTIIFTVTLQINTLVFSEPHRRAWPKDLSFYNTTFWNVTKAIEDPLNISQVSTTIKKYNKHLFNVTDIFYLSEIYNNRVIRIFAEILIPLNFTYPLPGLLMIHGYGGSHNSFLELGYLIAKEGYVVILIDAPDSGQSTKYPSKAPESLINTTRGPYDSYFYHVAWAGMRAISVLEQIPEVDKSRIAVTGGSMGGIMSFIIGAVDPRVKATIPIVAGGNFEDCFLGISLTVPLTTPEEKFSSERIQNFIKYFDVYAYASRLKIPVLMLSSTNDEFFTLIGLNDTYSVISSEKWWFLAPNWHHFSAYPGWTQSAISFLNYVFKGGSPLPRITSQKAVVGLGVTVHSTTNAHNGSLYVIWRNGFSGDSWKINRMQSNGITYSATLYPLLSGKVTYYVALKDEETGLFVVTTPIKSVYVSFSYVTVLLTFSILAIIGITFYSKDFKVLIEDATDLSKEHIARIVMFSAGFIGLWFDWLVFVNKTSFSYFDFIERYGNTFQINPYGALFPIFVFALFISLSFISKRKFLSYTAATFFSLLTTLILVLLQEASDALLILRPGIGGWIAILLPIFLLFYDFILYKIMHVSK